LKNGFETDPFVIGIDFVFFCVGQNIFHGSLRLDQLYFARPIRPCESHPALPATPVAGLFLCGSGCHPGGGVMGVPGRLAAQHVLDARKKKAL